MMRFFAKMIGFPVKIIRFTADENQENCIKMQEKCKKNGKNQAK